MNGKNQGNIYSLSTALRYLEKAFTQPKKLGIFSGLLKGLEPLKASGREKELEVALFDIRGAMMMDYNQAEKVKNNKGNIEIDESYVATKKRFDAMLANPKMETFTNSI